MNNAGAICSGSQGFPRFCAEKRGFFYISSKSNFLTSEPIITKRVPAFLFLVCFFNLPNPKMKFRERAKQAELCVAEKRARCKA